MVTKKPKGLGRGLEALLGPRIDDAAATTATPAIASIVGAKSTFSTIAAERRPTVFGSRGS